MDPWTLLSPAQARASRQLLDAERPRRRHVVVSLSGAHAYGFPSPDSDVDLKAIHVDPTRTLLGLRAQPTVAERLEWIDGIEVDYSSNEIGGVLAGCLKGNGNFLERIAGACALETSADLPAIRDAVLQNLSRRVHNHYRGFAHSQLSEWEATGKAKKALYVLRTTLTGRHLLRTREIVTDVTQLFDEAGFGEARELVARKLSGEQAQLPVDERARWSIVLARAFALLDEALESSVLPAEPPAIEALDDALIALRLRSIEG